MSLKSFASSVMVAAVAATSLLPLSTAASAHDWNDRGGFENHHRFEGREHRFGGYDRGYGHGYGYGHDEGYGYRRHHDNVGPALAIGAFATILGLAIASEAGHSGHGYHQYDRD